ncbi:MAG: DUF58 domain-containing protein [Planctomycetaceae bacterium]|jgi:uncharacterized protein (DUF58 family)|nr:DUF58 domain-containing protein [Planctomycetaceae bacterium]
MLFDPGFLRRLEYLSLISRRQFSGTSLAAKRSRQFGIGVEFADHQNYVCGDDLRYFDWNVYARFGLELIKRFSEERDLPVYLFLDTSQSMAFGEPVKFDYARKLTAALAYIALAGLDRISIIPFAEKMYHGFVPVRGKQQILRVMQFLETLQPSGKNTDFTAVMNGFVRRKQRSGLAVIISDFYDMQGYQTGIDTLRYSGYEANLIQIYGVSEAEPALRGDVQIFDSETGLMQNVTINENMLRRYKQKFSEFLYGIRRYALRCGCNYTVSATNVPFEDVIKKLLR